MNPDIFKEAVKSMDFDAVDPRVQVIGQLLFKGARRKKQEKNIRCVKPLVVICSSSFQEKVCEPGGRDCTQE